MTQFKLRVAAIVVAAACGPPPRGGGGGSGATTIDPCRPLPTQESVQFADASNAVSVIATRRLWVMIFARNCADIIDPIARLIIYWQGCNGQCGTPVPAASLAKIDEDIGRGTPLRIRTGQVQGTLITGLPDRVMLLAPRKNLTFEALARDVAASATEVGRLAASPGTTATHVAPATTGTRVAISGSLCVPCEPPFECDTPPTGGEGDTIHSVSTECACDAFHERYYCPGADEASRRGRRPAHETCPCADTCCPP